MSPQLNTLAKGIPFSYTGSIATGTDINYGGKPNNVNLHAQTWATILSAFRGRIVPLGADFRAGNRAQGSLGDFLLAFTKTSIAPYVGPILIHEGLAQVVPAPANAPVGGIWIEIFP